MAFCRSSHKGRGSLVKQKIPKNSIRKSTKNNLSIAQIHWGFPPIIGGVETHLTILLPEFVKMGHRVGLLTGSAQGALAESVYKGVNVYRIPAMDLNWLYKRGLVGLEKEIHQIYDRFFDKCKPDIVHCHNMHYFSFDHAKMLEDLCCKKGIPLVLTAHNIWDDNLYLDIMRKITWSHIIAVSHFIKKEMVGVGIDDKRITVVHHGIDQNIYSPTVDKQKIFKKYPRLRGKTVVFHPARMGLAKGCDVSIKALEFIRRPYPNVVMILAGTKNIIDWGDTQQKDISFIVSLIDSLKLRDNVLVDAFTIEDMPALYAISDVCIYPSTACEPFGLTMLEALASRKPMVVTNTGGMPEVIKDDVNGFVIPVKDFEALSSKVIQLLGNRGLRERLGYTGRQMIEQSFTKEIMTNNTLKVYRSLL